jgi:hypothetical protein
MMKELRKGGFLPAVIRAMPIRPPSLPGPKVGRKCWAGLDERLGVGYEPQHQRKEGGREG